jgi:multidrug efflux pump subunit AcrA (membrane-fusion protein)
VSVRIGQVVSAGAPLFEIVDLDRLWVRVPIYAGQVHEMDRQRDAAVLGLSEAGDSHQAKPIEAPPTADPLAASVDLYYEVDNSDGRFRPGERVTVRVPLKGEENSLVIPRAAVLRDIYGTAWVYVRSGDNEFRRERVAVQFTTEDLAVLSLGPEAGTPVVVDGAAELFGTEFGAGK